MASRVPTVHDFRVGSARIWARVKDLGHVKLRSEINARFLFNGRGDTHSLMDEFLLKNIFNFNGCKEHNSR